MNLSGHQWQKLRELRKFFLSAQPNRATYWDSEETLQLYDQTFAVRIGWRWDAVIAQLRSLGWQPQEKLLLDWGCGSTKAIVAKFPSLSVRTGVPIDEPFCLVLSHILGELDPASEELLASVVARASSLVWVEGGSSLLSKKLAIWRERLDWPVVAPCTHRQPCRMLAPENQAHWCHFFTRPPAQTFMDADWSEFAKQLEIDHRTVAFSYLVLDRSAANQPSGLARNIGSTRVYKASAKLQLCDANGLHDVELMKRDFPREWKALKKGWSPDLLKVEMSGNRVSELLDSDRLLKGPKPV
jgi:hypothetical protein